MNKTIKSLTKEQESKFPQYVDKWLSIGLNTEPCNFKKSVNAIKQAYKVVDLTPPKYFIGPVNSPIEGAIVQNILKDMVDNSVEFKNNNHLNEYVMNELQNNREKYMKGINISSQAFGYAEYWLSFYDYFQTECGLDLKKINPSVEIAKNSGWWTPLKNVAIIQHRPSEINMDEENRIHSVDGAAIKFRGDWDDPSNVYAVHGVRVPKKVIDRNYNIADIEKEENAEVRRVMIELYGQDKFIIESGAKEVNTDEFGTLYMKELNDDEPLMMVKVVNSTMEPDGSFKDYWIRVDPNAYGGLKTARAAVASTWRNPDGSFVFEKPEDYDCAVET